MRIGVETPDRAPIALVGEAWGEQEEKFKLPFQGASGQELNRMLHEGGLLRSECLTTNLLCARPPGNDFDLMCCDRKAVGDAKFHGIVLPPLKPGKYLKPEFYGELEELRLELSSPWLNLAIPLGNTALWALTLQTPSIGKSRGAVGESTLVPGLKILPTYHPAHVLRNWHFRVTVITDFIKAKHEAAFKDIIRTKREVWIEPTNIADLWDFHKQFVERSALVSLDIENPFKLQGRRLISCVGIAPDAKHALVIPFMTTRGSYWATADEEAEAWDFLQHVFNTKPILAQYGLHDVYALAHDHVFVRQWCEDTLFEHHALYPEMPKTLGFLGATYTNEVEWKSLNPRGYTSDEEGEE